MTGRIGSRIRGARGPLFDDKPHQGSLLFCSQKEVLPLQCDLHQVLVQDCRSGCSHYVSLRPHELQRTGRLQLKATCGRSSHARQGSARRAGGRGR